MDETNEENKIAEEATEEHKKHQVIKEKKNTERNKEEANDSKDDEIDLSRIKSIVTNEKFILCFLFLFSLALRIMFKNAGLWHFDSYADAKTVEEMLQYGRFEYSYGYGAPGAMAVLFIVYFFHHLLTGAASAEFSYFLLTFITASLAVVLIYIITKKITKNKFISMAAALFFSATPIFLSETVYPKTHGPSVFFGLLAGYLLMVAGDKDTLKESWLYIVLSGLFFGLNIAIRPDGVLYIIPFGVLYLNPRIENRKLIIRKNRFTLSRLAIFVLPMAVILIGLFIPRVVELGGVSQFIELLNPKTETRGGWLGMISQNTMTSFGHVTTSITWLGWIAVLIGLFYFYAKKMWFELAVMIGWFLMFFLLFGNLAVVHARFLLPGLIPLAILMAAGCYIISKQHKTAGYVVVFILLGAMFYNIYPVISYRHEHSGTKEFSMYVAQKTPENAVVMANDLGFFIQYYGHRKIIIHPRTGDPDEIGSFIAQLFNYTDEGRQIYATGEGFAIDPGNLVQQALVHYFDIQQVGAANNEWYGDGTLKLAVYQELLFKLTPKPEFTGQKTRDIKISIKKQTNT